MNDGAVERPPPDARKAGRIPTEHGLEAVPADTRRPWIAPLIGLAALLVLLGWFVVGPTSDKRQDRVGDSPATSTAPNQK